MKESELIGKVHSAVSHQCQQRGYAAPADVLVDVGVLPKQKYEDAGSYSYNPTRRYAAFICGIVCVKCNTGLAKLFSAIFAITGLVSLSSFIKRVL